MVKFHWQIYMVMLSEKSKMCSCKWRTLTTWFDKLASCRRGKRNKLFVSLLAFGKFTPSACYTRSSKQTLCVGLEVDKIEAMIRNRYNRIPHPALNTKRKKDTHNEDGIKTKTAQAKSQEDSSSECQRVFEERGKKESRAYDELVQVKWPKEAESLLYFLIESIQKS